MSLRYMGVPDYCPHGEYTDKQCDKCEIERLRKIVDSLPQTADGVPVVPGMTCWYVSCGGRVNSFDVEDLSDIATDIDDYGRRYYATREAAREAAIDAEKEVKDHEN